MSRQVGSWHNITTLYGLPRFFVFVFSFVIVLVFVRSASCNFLFLYRFRFTNCHNSRFRTPRTKCNNSSFRFHFRYENSSVTGHLDQR